MANFWDGALGSATGLLKYGARGRLRLGGPLAPSHIHLS